MKTKGRKIVFSAALAVGAVWNLLCLIHILPAIVGLGSLFILLPLLFPTVFSKRERFAQAADLQKQDRFFGSGYLYFLFAGIVTLIVCMVYLL